MLSIAILASASACAYEVGALGTVGFVGQQPIGDWSVTGLWPTAVGGHQRVSLDHGSVLEPRGGGDIFDVALLPDGAIGVSARRAGRATLAVVDPDDATVVDRIALDVEEIDAVDLGPDLPVLFAEREGRVGVRLFGDWGRVVDDEMRVLVDGGEARRIHWDAWGITAASPEPIRVRVEAGGASHDFEVPVVDTVDDVEVVLPSIEDGSLTVTLGRSELVCTRAISDTHAVAGAPVRLSGSEVLSLAFIEESPFPPADCFTVEGLAVGDGVLIIGYPGATTTLPVVVRS